MSPSHPLRRLCMMARPAHHASLGLLVAAGLVGCGTVAGPWGQKTVVPSEQRSESATRPGVSIFPMAIESSAVAERLPEPNIVYPTPAFQPGRSAYTSQAELQSLLQTLVGPAAPGRDKALLIPIGKSQLGTQIDAVLFSRLPQATPASVARGTRPTVLLIGQQHGDEPASGEALLTLAQQLTEAGPLASVLDRINVLIVPRANPDAAAEQMPASANGIDINRDHLLLRTPEARALAHAMREFKPVVVVDSHEYAVQPQLFIEKFGAMQRADALLQYGLPLNAPESVGNAAEEWFRQPMLEALAALGLTAEWHHTTSEVIEDKSVSMGGVQPETLRNVAGLRNAVSLLVETRGVGLDRRHLKRRMQTQLALLSRALRSAADHADDLVKLRRTADAAVQSQACRGKLVLDARLTPGDHTLHMLHPATGTDLPVEVKWHSALALTQLKSRNRPCGYWLGADQTDAVGRLQALGVRVERLAEPASLQGDPAPAAATARRSSRFKAPVESYYIGLDQPLANLIAAVMEPESPEGFLTNQVITAADRQARISARPRGKRILVP